MIQRIENQLRLKRPNLALEADYGSSRKSAINLACYSCMGGSVGSVSNCKSYACPLWRFRPNPLTIERPKGKIPNKEELEKLWQKEQKQTP